MGIPNKISAIGNFRYAFRNDLFAIPHVIININAALTEDGRVGSRAGNLEQKRSTGEQTQLYYVDGRR